MGDGELVPELEHQVRVSDVRRMASATGVCQRGGGPGPRLHGPIESGALVLQVRHDAVVDSDGSRDTVRSVSGLKGLRRLFGPRAAAWIDFLGTRGPFCRRLGIVLLCIVRPEVR